MYASQITRAEPEITANRYRLDVCIAEPYLLNAKCLDNIAADWIEEFEASANMRVKEDVSKQESF